MPAETTIQTQSEADAKMVDLPAEGSSVDVLFLLVVLFASVLS